MSVFEIIMLSCFGLSWPIAAYKSYKTGRAAGKSLLFMAAIWIGYVAGILHKLIYSRDLVIFLYIFNLLMVSLDLVLTTRNMKRERSEQSNQSGSQA